MRPVAELAESQFDQLLETKRDELNRIKDDVDKAHRAWRHGRRTHTHAQTRAHALARVLAHRV